MQNTVLDYLIPLVIIAIFALLWHARRQPFARIGDSWTIILTGFAFLSLGEFLHPIVSGLSYYGYFGEQTARGFATAGGVAIVGGLITVGLGVYRWLTGVRILELNWAAAKETNTELRRRVSRDGMLLSTVPAALYRTMGVASGKASESVFVNDKIEDLLGYSAAAFVEDPLLFNRLMHPDDRERLHGFEKQELWDRDSIVIEHRFKHRDGEYRWLRRHLARMNESSGDVVEWHGCAFDVTDLKRAEARLANFLEAAPDPVVTTDDRGAIILTNAQAELLFGYSKTELLGRFIHTLIPENEDGEPVDGMRSFLGNSTLLLPVPGSETQGRRKDGSEFPIEISVSPIENGDEKLLAFAIRDVSARIDIEEQLRQSQKMEAVGQLTGGIAHDFNNLLTIVIGNLQLLELDSEQGETTRNATQAAMDASVRAAELVKRLLAYSRRQKLESRETDINDLIVGIESMLTGAITENIELKTSLAKDLWTARIDSSQLETTLLNLAINARDALGSGGILRVETCNTVLDHSYTERHREVKPGDYVLIAVSDNGEGISKEILPHVFEPFYSTKEVGKGSGLGLSMVYGFVKQSQGHIKVYSEVGHGTTIKIYIPRCITSPEETNENAVDKPVSRTGSEKILLVEDDDLVADVTQKMLSSLGYQVIRAGSGEEALRVLGEHDDVGLLFTDMVMPGGMTGAELAEHAIEKRPDLQVLFTSGYTDMSIADNGLLHSSNNILSKPYRQEELARIVRHTLDRVR